LPGRFDWFPRVLIKNGEEEGGYEMNPLGLLIKRAPQVSGKEKNKSLAPLCLFEEEEYLSWRIARETPGRLKGKR
jgi:hypothetical protein